MRRILLASSLFAAISLPTLHAVAADRDAAPSPDVLTALHLKSCAVISPLIAPAPTAAPSLTPSLSCTLDLGTPAKPHAVTFLLDPYPLRSPNFKLIVSDDTGDHEQPAPPSTTFHGTDPVTGDELFASVSHNLLRATIVPAQPGAPLRFIQPFADAGASAARLDPALHALFTSADILPLHATCGVDDCVQCKANAAATPTFIPRGPGTCRYVELTAECDWPFYTLNGASATSCVQDVEVVILGMNALYRNTAGFVPQVRFALQRVVVRATNAADPYNAFPLPPTEADSGTILSTSRTFWNNLSATTPDLVHLFSGRNFNGSVIGLAYVNVVCGNSRYGIVQSRFTSNLGARYQVSAHEIGHNFSFTHDDASGSNIMNSGINAGAPATIFSAQSTSQYTTNIGSFTCLANAVPDALPDSASILPNQVVTIDVLANDGTGIICTSPIVTFNIPSGFSALGGTVVRSVGTGPGGRDQITYTPPANVAGAEDSFNYSAGTQTVPVYVTIITPRAPDQPYTAVLSGLKATYYDIRNPDNSVTLYGTMPDLTTFPSFGTNVVSQINYPLSTGNAVGSNRNFAVGAIFTGFIQVPTTAFYQFWTVSDDLSRVSIGNQVIVTNGSVQTVGEATGSIALAPGRHAIKIEYTNYVGNTQLVLSYAYPGQGRITVPNTVLWRAAGPCNADFNGAGGTTVQDIFDFLSAWFSGLPTADFNGVNGITVQDIFDFLAVWFGPC